MSECKFCESLESYKNINNFKNNHPEYYTERLFHEYNVALVVRSWVKGRKAMATRMTDYRYRGIGYKLNYCPECGKKVAIRAWNRRIADDKDRRTAEADTRES